MNNFNKHVVLQYPSTEDMQDNMFKSSRRLIERILSDHGNVHCTCMGWWPDDESVLLIIIEFR